MNQRNVDSDQPGNAGWATVAIAWLVVLVPLIWGVWETIKKAAPLFR
jgi:hypothetical protein